MHARQTDTMTYRTTQTSDGETSPTNGATTDSGKSIHLMAEHPPDRAASRQSQRADYSQVLDDGFDAAMEEFVGLALGDESLAPDKWKQARLHWAPIRKTLEQRAKEKEKCKGGTGVQKRRVTFSLPPPSAQNAQKGKKGDAEFEPRITTTTD